MSGTVSPIPPPLGTNPCSPNRVDTMPTNNPNNTTTTNVVQNVVNVDLPQLLDSRGGSHVTNVPAFDIEDFYSWKDRYHDLATYSKCSFPLVKFTAWTDLIHVIDFSIVVTPMYRIFTKGQKQSQTGQYQERNWKEREKPKPKVQKD
ncbi:hypothetical protein Tco_0243186 [Tanacetum coccineum]